MPREQDVIYCIMVDENGSIQNTSMIMRSHAEHVLKDAENMLRVKGAINNGIS